MKSKITCICFCLLLVATGAWAGWAPQVSGTTKDLASIYFPSPSIGFAGGKNGTLLNTTDSGINWGTVLGYTWPYDISDVLFISSTEGYIIAASGEVFISKDGGTSFTPTIFGGITVETSIFRKGSALGTDRALAVYLGTNEGSAILRSVDSGTSWSGIIKLPSLEVYGTALGPGDNNSVLTWSWGKQNGKYVILRNNEIVYTNPLNRVIKSVFFVDNTRGYAVGENGLFLRLSMPSGLGTVTATDISSSIGSATMNSCYFLYDSASHYYFGWVVGNAGNSWFVVDNSSLITESYTITGNPDLNSIFVKQVGTSLSVHAFIAGAGGVIYKLASPNFSGVNPSARPKGWIGTIEATGTGFLVGAQFYMRVPGTTESDDNVEVVNTTVESDTKISSFVIISPEVSAGTRDAVVANPDGTTSSETFTINPGTGTLFISSEVWLKSGNQYNRYYPSHEATVTSLLPVSYEVYSTNASLNKNTLISYILAKYVPAGLPARYILHIVPTTAFSQDTLTPNIVKVQTTLPGSLPTGESVRLTFYAEDPLSGDVTQEPIAVGVQVQDDSGQTFVPSPLAAPGLPAAAIPLENTWDEDTNATLPVTIIIPQYYKLSNSITVRVTDFTGQLLLEEPVDTTNVVDRITVMLRSKKLPPTVTAGLKILTVTDNLTRKIIAKNKFMMAPKIMVPNMKKRL